MPRSHDNPTALGQTRCNGQRSSARKHDLWRVMAGLVAAIHV